MATATVLKPLTIAEYLAAERDAVVRHEYRNGELVAMAGGSRAHNLLVTRIARLLGNHLETTACRIYQSDMKVWIAASHRFYYPNVMVCCNPVEEEPDEYYETRPRLIIEVLSPGTAVKDNGEKRDDYQTLTTLQEYLLLDHAQRTVLLYRRVGGDWTRLEFGVGSTLDLISVNYQVRLDDLF